MLAFPPLLAVVAASGYFLLVITSQWIWIRVVLWYGLFGGAIGHKRSIFKKAIGQKGGVAK